MANNEKLFDCAATIVILAKVNEEERGKLRAAFALLFWNEPGFNLETFTRDSTRVQEG